MIPILSESEKISGAKAVASIKAHDSKRFRVRALSHEGDIYERYFSKSIAGRVSWAQLATAGFVLLAQVVVMVRLMDHYEYFDTLSQLGGGIWSSIFTSIAAVVTLWASRKATYGRLHGSMALHIISILVQIIATMIVFGSGIWELKRSMRRIKHDLYSDKYDSYSSDSYGRGYNYNANSGANYYNNNETVDSLENEQANIRKAERNADLYKLFHDTLLVSVMMGVAGIGQALMSFFMALSTGRAICCGRTHLEGRFLEMEAVGREDSDASINIHVGAKEKCRVGHSHSQGQPQQTRTEANVPGPESITGPPPYSPELFEKVKC